MYEYISMSVIHKDYILSLALDFTVQKLNIFIFIDAIIGKYVIYYNIIVCFVKSVLIYDRR